MSDLRSSEDTGTHTRHVCAPFQIKPNADELTTFREREWLPRDFLKSLRRVHSRPPEFPR
jgi:hypothetical protein